MAETPYIGFTNKTMEQQPKVSIGDLIICPNCKGLHELEPDDNGGFLLGFYRCNDKSYLASIRGHLVVGVKADCGGKVDFDKLT